jgi:TRAP-type C4-dicarboxylate transport system substrate-binding protein
VVLRHPGSTLSRTAILVLACFSILSLPLAAAARQTYVLKFATLAPDGSAWMQLLDAWADEVRDRSDGRLVFKIYPGGVQGDEPDVLTKIRFGQLQGGAFTGYGIGHIYSPARALEVPFLFNNIDEIDYVRKRFMPTIEQGYRDNGYELLGWMEVGLIYFFSKEPIHSLDDLKKRRIWEWTGDPMGQAFFDAAGISPVPLSIIDVYTSLSTGLIDTVYCPPLGAIALQWYTKTHYVTNVPMANGIGSLVVSSRFFQRLPQDLQKLLKSTGEKTGQRLIEVTRRDNRESLKILKDKGMEFILNREDLNPGQVAEISKKAEDRLMQSGYIPESTFRDINAWMADYRAATGGKAPVNAVR